MAERGGVAANVLEGNSQFENFTINPAKIGGWRGCTSDLNVMTRVRLSNLGLYFFTLKVPSDANFRSNLLTDLAETLTDF